MAVILITGLVYWPLVNLLSNYNIYACNPVCSIVINKGGLMDSGLAGDGSIIFSIALKSKSSII